MHFDGYLKRSGLEKWVLASLIILAALFYGATIFSAPLVDYDEATYAEIVVETLRSGDYSTFLLSNVNWFEKPPLYFWSAMLSISLFGEDEFAFRIPSVIASLVCLCLTFLITRELLGSTTAASIAFLVLLFSPPFFVFAREARLDSGVIMGILAALYFCIRGWRNENYLLWVFPALAIGFLFKSVIVFFAYPVILIFSVFYSEWKWLKVKYLWLGLPISLILLLPWHIAQTIRFGRLFWDDYVIHHVFERSISTLTGSSNYYDYLKILWMYYRPWLFVICGIVVILVGVRLWDKNRSPFSWPFLLSSGIAAGVVIALLTPAQTHLSTYIMPAFPFFAMFIAAAWLDFSRLHFRVEMVLAIFFLPLCIFAAVRSIDAVEQLITPFHYEEREIGRALKLAGYSSNTEIPFYALDWPQHGTMNFYAGGAIAKYINPNTESGKVLTAPVYFMTNTMAENFFFSAVNLPRPGYEHLKVLYQGEYLVLFYSDRDVQLPVFVQP